MLPKRSQRYLALLLKPIVLPALAIALPAWPLLAAACAIPVIGVMAIPILLLISVLLLYTVAWICYLFLARRTFQRRGRNAPPMVAAQHLPLCPHQPDPVRQSRPRRLPIHRPAFRIVFPAIFDWSYRRIMVIGTTKGSRVVKEGIPYGSPSRGKTSRRLLSPPTPPPPNTPTAAVV